MTSRRRSAQVRPRSTLAPPPANGSAASTLPSSVRAGPMLASTALVAALLAGCAVPHADSSPVPPRDVAPALGASPTAPGATTVANGPAEPSKQHPSCSAPEHRDGASLTLPDVIDDDPRVTLPVLPPWADAPSDAGAAAAVKHFMALLDYAYRTGDLGPFEAMSHKFCGYCRLKATDVETLREAGSYTTGLLPEWLDEDRATKVAGADDRWRVSVRAITAVVTEVDRDGVVANVDESRLHEVRATVSHGKSGWAVREVEVTNTEVLTEEE